MFQACWPQFVPLPSPPGGRTGLRAPGLPSRPAHVDALEAVQQLHRGVHAAQPAEARVDQVARGQLDVVGVPQEALAHGAPVGGVGSVKRVEGHALHRLHHGLPRQGGPKREHVGVGQGEKLARSCGARHGAAARLTWGLRGRRRSHP